MTERQRVAQVTVTCGTEIDGDVYEDGSVTHIRFTLGSSYLLLRQKACAALGMADRVGMRMEYLGPDDRWFALVDSDDMEDAVEFTRHPGPPEPTGDWHGPDLLEPEPEPQPDTVPLNSPSRVTGPGNKRLVEKKLAIRLVMPGELVNQQQARGTVSVPEGMSATPAVDQQTHHVSPRNLHATAAGNAVVLEATVHGWHAEEARDVVAPGSVAHAVE